jgi:hypothetical protein
VSDCTLCLVSLEPCFTHLRNPSGHAPFPPYREILRWTADAQITALQALPAQETLLVTTRNAALTCKHLSFAHAHDRPAVTDLWNRTLPSPHVHLSVCPSLFITAASAAAGEPAIAIWRFPPPACKAPPAKGHSLAPPSTDGLSVEWLDLSCPVSALHFWPDPRRACERQRAHGAWAATLMAVGHDGCIRLWMDTNLSDTLPPSLTSPGTLLNGTDNGTNVGEQYGRSMCLVHVLSPPNSSPLAGAGFTASWANPERIRDHPHAGAQQRVSWIIAVRTPLSREARGDAAAVGKVEAPMEALTAPDEVSVWVVTVDAVEHGGGAPMALAAEAKGLKNGARGSSSGGKDGVLAEVGDVVVCRTPRVTAALWGQDELQVDSATLPACVPYFGIPVCYLLALIPQVTVLTSQGSLG